MTVRVGIVGCGLIGARRARALAGADLAACADVEPGRAEAVARNWADVRTIGRWQELVSDDRVDIVVVATTNDALAEIAVAAIEAGKHVLVEKPAGRSVAEIDRIAKAAKQHGRLVRVGFNHRYHPAFLAARRIVEAGTIGPLMFVRGRYGHGGRVGYDREWRADAIRSGGGELIDQGVHLIDLSQWLLGPFAGVDGAAHTYFWDMPVDDNAFMRLTTATGQVAFLHVSCTEWKNLFSFEIYGRTGKLHIEGLGGSYGIERLAHYQMRPEMGPPDTTIYEYPQGDLSWDLEFAEFLEDIRLGREPAAGLEAARAALAVVEAVYTRVEAIVIITRSPLRITLGGGGTDLPSYYRQHGGFLIAAAIDKHVYVTVTRPFSPGIYLKYSQLEHVDAVDDVRHPIIREALKLLGVKAQVEITTLADIPAGTGLGSSGSFTTALLRALCAFERRHIGTRELAELASDIEIHRLGEPTGKQDPYAAAFGGLTAFTFHQNDEVEARPLKMPGGTLFDLEDDLLLFFTGYSRRAGSILADQKARTEQSDDAMLAQMHVVKELGMRSLAALEAGRTVEFGNLMHEHWEHKRRRSAGMTNPQIDEWYDLGRKNGAVGGKLVGAGGGGFLMFYAENHRRLRDAMARAGLEEVRFRFSFEGTKVLFD